MWVKEIYSKRGDTEQRPERREGADHTTGIDRRAWQEEGTELRSPASRGAS